MKCDGGFFYDKGIKMTKNNNLYHLNQILYIAFFLPVLLSSEISRSITKNNDLLSGEQAVRTILKADIVHMIILVATEILYVIFVIKMHKKVSSIREMPMNQLILEVGLIILFVVVDVMIFSDINKTNADLKYPAEKNIYEYALYSEGNNDYLAFTDNGNTVLLAIPQEKFKELQQMGKPEKNSDNFVYNELQKRGYSNISSYTINNNICKVKYYQHAVIYIDCEFQK